MRIQPGINPWATSERTHRHRWLLSVLLAGFAMLLFTPVAHAADRIYWSNYETDEIAWANLCLLYTSDAADE